MLSTLLRRHAKRRQIKSNIVRMRELGMLKEQDAASVAQMLQYKTEVERQEALRNSHHKHYDCCHCGKPAQPCQYMQRATDRCLCPVRPGQAQLLRPGKCRLASTMYPC